MSQKSFMKEHIPVLLQEVTRYLDPKPSDVVVDATFGFGGHSKEILNKIGKRGRLIAFEKDPEVLRLGRKYFSKSANLELVNDDFENIVLIIENLKIKSVDKILFDLGVSSYHFERSARGFSFLKDEPLDMRLSPNTLETAADLINETSERELADLFYSLSDEKRSRRIARAIVLERRKKRFRTTAQLRDLLERIIPRSSKIHPATKVFQALRIAVNDELDKISRVLPQAVGVLKRRGRIAVISFHSGEDRIVKNIFKQLKEEGKIEILTKKPIVPERQEIIANPRSRSAKLRVARRN